MEIVDIILVHCIYNLEEIGMKNTSSKQVIINSKQHFEWEKLDF